MKKQLSFPQGFWWGAASSGPQTEGQFDKAHENVMDYWFRTAPEPLRKTQLFLHN